MRFTLVFMNKNIIKTSSDLHRYKLNLISNIEDLIKKLNKNKISLNDVKKEIIVISKDIFARIKDKKSSFLNILICVENFEVIVENMELETQLIILLDKMKKEVNSEIILK